MNMGSRQLQLRFGLAVIASLALILPVTMSGQNSTLSPEGREYAGRWHWIFNGQPFATMVLEQKADGFTGSVTNATIDADPDGKLTNAVVLPGNSPIIKSSLVKGTLHIVCKVEDDEVEWVVRLTSATTAEIAPAGTGAPKLAIHAEKSQ